MAKLSTDISEKIDIECRKSDNLYLSVTLETGSAGSGEYFNLSVYTSVAFIAKNQNGNSVLELYKEGTAAQNTGVKYYGVITTNTAGTIQITANSNAMTIPEGTYSYTCKIGATGLQHTIMHGKFKIVD